MAQLKKILLVDDDDDLREALSEQLIMTEDFDVFEAANGTEAMTKAKEALYDLIILDVGLPEKETNILKFLYRSNDGVVPRDVLLHEVWGYNAGVTTHTLETHIYRLRQKIEPDPSNARLLVTESGGYRLMA